MASVNIVEEIDPDLKHLRRYESVLHSRYRYFMKLFHEKNNNRMIDELRNDWEGESVQPQEVGPSPIPDDNKLDEPEMKAQDEVEEEPDVPIIFDARVEKKLRRSENRRSSKKRKAERLQA